MNIPTPIGSTGRTVYVPYMVAFYGISCKVNIRSFVPWICHGKKTHQVTSSFSVFQGSLTSSRAASHWGGFLGGDGGFSQGDKKKASGSGELRESQLNCKLNIATWKWKSLSRIQGEMNNILSSTQNMLFSSNVHQQKRGNNIPILPKGFMSSGGTRCQSPKRKVYESSCFGKFSSKFTKVGVQHFTVLCLHWTWMNKKNSILGGQKWPNSLLSRWIGFP